MLFIFLYVLVNNTPNEVNMSLYISLYRSQRGYVFVHRAVFIDSTARWPFISKTLEHSHLYVYISSNNHVSCYRVTYIPGGGGGQVLIGLRVEMSRIQITTGPWRNVLGKDIYCNFPMPTPCRIDRLWFEERYLLQALL